MPPPVCALWQCACVCVCKMFDLENACLLRCVSGCLLSYQIGTKGLVAVGTRDYRTFALKKEKECKKKRKNASNLWQYKVSFCEPIGGPMRYEPPL